MSDYHRKQERKTFNRIIPLWDAINDCAFGEVANLTTEGLMALTDQAIATRSLYQLRMTLPYQIDGGPIIELGADCLWTRHSDDYHRHWAGFSIIDISDADLERLQVLIEQHGQSST